MKVIEITGKNYFGSWDKTRTASRGIVLDGDRILLSYETKTNQFMIPGGGLEKDESGEDCCIREIAEETGVKAEILHYMCEIDEYYENWKWVNQYYICRVTGTAEIKLTSRESEVGMVPIWLPLSEIKAVFSQHNAYDGTDEMRRGMYLREYTALSELEHFFKAQR